MNIIEGHRNCTRVRPLLDSYLSSELLIETNQEILEHLQGCSECSSFLRSRGQVREVLRRAQAGVEVPGELRIRIQNSIRGVETMRPRPSGWPMMSLIAAGLALVLATGILMRMVQSDAARLLLVGWNNHLKCAMAGHYPAEPPSDEKMASVLGTEYEGLVELSRARMPGFRVRQGHRCTMDGRRFAHVILQKDDVLLSVSVVKKAEGENFPRHRWLQKARDLDSTQVNGVEVTGWETGDHLVFVSSNQPRGENMRIAEGMAPGIREMLQPKRSAMAGFRLAR